MTCLWEFISCPGSYSGKHPAGVCQSSLKWQVSTDIKITFLPWQLMSSWCILWDWRKRTPVVQLDSFVDHNSSRQHFVSLSILSQYCISLIPMVSLLPIEKHKTTTFLKRFSVEACTWKTENEWNSVIFPYRVPRSPIVNQFRGKTVRVAMKILPFYFIALLYFFQKFYRLFYEFFCLGFLSFP